MRLNGAGLIDIAIAMAPVLSTAAISAPIGPRAETRASQIIALAYPCPVGQHWVAAGYFKHGKWRPGHCAKGGIVR